MTVDYATTLKPCTPKELKILKSWLTDRIEEIRPDYQDLEDECPGLWMTLHKLHKELSDRASPVGITSPNDFENP